MTFKTRIQFVAGASAALVFAAVLAWFALSSRPDPVAALRQRLVGHSARDVESVLGLPAFRDNDDRTWHYLGEAQARQFIGDAASASELIVELDAGGTVERVYIEDY